MLSLVVLPTWAARVRECRICHVRGLLHREQEADARPLFFDGNFSSRLLLVLEAPNYDDAFRWGRLTIDGDKDPTGKFLGDCLRHEVGIEPREVMITNSVLCLPAKSTDGKYPVTGALRKACAGRLETFIDSMSPVVIATLGVKALHALKLIEPHAFRLKLHVGQPQQWYGRALVPLAHPSRLGRAYRTEELQRA